MQYAIYPTELVAGGGSGQGGGGEVGRFGLGRIVEREETNFRFRGCFSCNVKRD
jgi:hypothetical protein